MKEKLVFTNKNGETKTFVLQYNSIPEYYSLLDEIDRNYGFVLQKRPNFGFMSEGKHNTFMK